VIGVYVQVPVACFRKGLARELFETHTLPPPSTSYGFLLSLVGETQRDRHIGCRVTATLLGQPAVSSVLRTLWRVKNKNTPQGTGDNAIPGHQQLLTHVELVLWLDSSDEQASHGAPRLEQRVEIGLDPARRGQIDRFGGLSLGESTHLVDEVSLLTERLRECLLRRFPDEEDRRTFLCHDEGRIDLPVWVDHVGSKGTRSVAGNLVPHDLAPPPRDGLPRIQDE